jgi:hypothetical protein
MTGAASHAKMFPIAVGDTHGPSVGQTTALCDACHFDTTTGKPAASFTIFSCINCHVQVRSTVWHDDPAALKTFHLAAGVVGFPVDPAAPAASVACRACHPTGLAVDHAKKFPLPHQNAAGTVVAKCADCHVDQADRTILACAGCHASTSPVVTGHAKVPDFVAADADAAHSASLRCLRCHADSTLPITVATHTPFLIEGTGGHTGASGGSCLACHPAFQVAPAKTFAADFKTTTCTTCHVPVASGSTVYHDNTGGLLAALHAADGVTTFTFADASCLACHPDGAGGAPANHESLFPRASGTKHAGIACSSCHTNPANRKDLTAFACYACHVALTVPPATVPLLAGHIVSGYGIAVVYAAGASTPVDMTSSVNCLRCHGDAQVNRVASHPGGDSGFSRSQHDLAGCLTCHSTMRSDKAWAADFRATRGCVVCHPNGTGG